MVRLVKNFLQHLSDRPVAALCFYLPDVIVAD